MGDELNAALGQGKITKSQYDTYVLFHLNEMGYDYLKNTLMAIVLDPIPLDAPSTMYARKEGERDAWARVQRTISDVIQILEMMKYDRNAISVDRDEDRDATERKLNSGTWNNGS